MEANTSRMVNLNGTNYHLWKGKMEDLLYVKDYYLPVFEKQKPDNKTEAQWKLLHRQVCGYIRQWVDDNILNHISGETDASSLWNKLEELYARKTGNNKLFLIKQMMSLKYRDGKPMTDHLNAFQGIINQLAGMNIKFEDEVQGLWLLGTLPDSWETFRMSLSNSALDGIITMELAKNSVLNEEDRRKSQGSSQSDILIIEKRGRSKSRGPKNRDKSKSKTNKFANVECYYCGLKGHIKKYCRQLKRDNKKDKRKEKKNDDSSDDDRVATVTDDFLIMYDDDVVNLMCHETSWVIDSGASIHATSRKEFFTSYTSGDFGDVKMGNNGLAKAIGMGDVCLETNNGTMLLLKNVKHIPNIRLNLISAGKLDDEGFSSNFSSGQWKLSKGSMTVARGKKYSSLYFMQAKIADNSINTVKNEDTIELWHRRVGHMNDHSRKLWVYTLKTKDQVLDVFKQFQASVERQTGKKLKCIRTDNGGEYSGPFDEYCRQLGIRHQKTPPKTPQLNGLAERMNRTLVERVRCLLSQAQLSISFWGEALNTVVHVLNRTPCVPLDFEVPDKVWSGKDVSYDHLRVFGCKAFVHIPKDERSKLDVKTRQCVFLGYGQDEFGYRFYDPMQKKLVRSRDAIFIEDQTIQDIEKLKEEMPQYSDTLIDLDPIPPTQPTDEVQDGQHGTGDIDTHTQVEIDDDVHQLPTSEVSTDISLRRSTRIRQSSTRYPTSEYLLLTDGGEPECYAEAVESEQRKEWIYAMQDEMKSLYENHTFELVKLPKDKRALKNKWVYRIKQEEYTSQPRYKARLVVKGFSQRKGVDFDEIFSPVVKMSSIRVVLSIAASLDLEIEQMDVKTAFLHGDLNKEIYMEQPKGFKIKGKEDYVCKLKKSLYGLKQAPRQWYKKFETVMGEQGYPKTSSDHCIFIQKFSDDDFIILLLYVDNMLIVGRNASRIDWLKKQLSKSFAMKDLEPAKQILGIRIHRDRAAKKLCISQEHYIEKVLERFNMSNAKVVSTPLATHFRLSTKQSPTTDKEKEDMEKVPYASAVGSLMYAMICTRPDIAHAVGVVSRFLSNPGREHWNAVKWIMRYLRGTSNFKLTFGSGKPLLVGYTDSDMAGDVDTRKSTTGYLMTLSGGAVAWQSRLQKCVVLSTTEAEFIAATEACKELLWMKRFL
ncbi:Retrovirus-related Pol polyprotein from transposon TNT 1-94 [Melia azedarach]|uniref:Retrovirus-related Pol polyprotein from transposon TNT 1-94 n=1 Tax=Melia azedarach TaxID=155640 RepID=A0ACC1Y6W5_MELAZ|nr:Retrovirus-related Pol polyprotein from transposon TNT 1-94 [Melia azedarach]